MCDNPRISHLPFIVAENAGATADGYAALVMDIAPRRRQPLHSQPHHEIAQIRVRIRAISLPHSLSRHRPSTAKRFLNWTMCWSPGEFQRWKYANSEFRNLPQPSRLLYL